MIFAIENQLRKGDCASYKWPIVRSVLERGKWCYVYGFRALCDERCAERINCVRITTKWASRSVHHLVIRIRLDCQVSLDGDALCQPWFSSIILLEALGRRMHQLPYWDLYRSVRISCIALLCEWVPNSRTSASTLKVYCITSQGCARLMRIARARLGSRSGFKLWCSGKSCLWVAMLVATYVEGAGHLWS